MYSLNACISLHCNCKDRLDQFGNEKEPNTLVYIVFVMQCDD